MIHPSVRDGVRCLALKAAQAGGEVVGRAVGRRAASRRVGKGSKIVAKGI